MYRQQIAKKTSLSLPSKPINKKTRLTSSYGSLSGTIQRATANPETLSRDEWLQLDSAIGTRATNEIRSGKRTSYVPEFKGISAQLWGDSAQVSEPIQAKGKDDVNESEVQPENKTPWVPEFKGISAQLWGDSAQVDAPIQTKGKDDVGVSEVKPENNTGLPDNLKAGVENLSGYSLDDVRVHYNSPKPAQIGAYAYTIGSEIYVGHGQEKHLPHESWHVVQQKQGKVKATGRKKGKPINDEERLEHEADVKANQLNQKTWTKWKKEKTNQEVDRTTAMTSNFKGKEVGWWNKRRRKKEKEELGGTIQDGSRNKRKEESEENRYWRERKVAEASEGSKAKKLEKGIDIEATKVIQGAWRFSEKWFVNSRINYNPENGEIVTLESEEYSVTSAIELVTDPIFTNYRDAEELGDVYIRTGWHTSPSDPRMHIQAHLGISEEPWQNQDFPGRTVHIYTDGSVSYVHGLHSGNPKKKKKKKKKRTDK